MAYRCDGKPGTQVRRLTRPDIYYNDPAGATYQGPIQPFGGCFWDSTACRGCCQMRWSTHQHGVQALGSG